MRLLTQNLLICNMASCRGHNIPLRLLPAETTTGETPFDPDITRKMLSKVSYPILRNTAADLGQALPFELDEGILQDEQVLRMLHNLLFNVRNT